MLAAVNAYQATVGAALELSPYWPAYRMTAVGETQDPRFSAFWPGELVTNELMWTVKYDCGTDGNKIC